MPWVGLGWTLTGPWAGLDWALGGPGLGFGWAWTGSWASQVAKSSLCPEFIHVQVLTKVCLIGDRRLIGCWSHMMKSKLCPDFILVHSLAWCDSGVVPDWAWTGPGGGGICGPWVRYYKLQNPILPTVYPCQSFVQNLSIR